MKTLKIEKKAFYIKKSQEAGTEYLLNVFAVVYANEHVKMLNIKILKILKCKF